MHELLSLALDAAQAAGQRIAELYETELEVRTKSSAIDLVTRADHEAEALIVERLRSARPDDAILAEESGEVGAGCGPRWLVDPLDGTTNFAHGFPFFCVSIARYDEGRGEVAVVHDPLRDESFCAVAGEGAWLSSPRGQRRLRVTDTTQLRQSLLATGFAYDRATASRNNIAELNRLLPQVRGIRRAGSAALDTAYVAAGRLDGYWEMSLSPWDWGAGALLVREAGGWATTLDGAPWTPGDASLVAAGAGLHERLRAALRPSVGRLATP